MPYAMQNDHHIIYLFHFIGQNQIFKKETTIDCVTPNFKMIC